AFGAGFPAGRIGDRSVRSRSLLRKSSSTGRCRRVGSQERAPTEENYAADSVKPKEPGRRSIKNPLLHYLTTYLLFPRLPAAAPLPRYRRASAARSRPPDRRAETAT